MLTRSNAMVGRRESEGSVVKVKSGWSAAVGGKTVCRIWYKKNLKKGNIIWRGKYRINNNGVLLSGIFPRLLDALKKRSPELPTAVTFLFVQAGAKLWGFSLCDVVPFTFNVDEASL
jgi:hypothetical protein